MWKLNGVSAEVSRVPTSDIDHLFGPRGSTLLTAIIINTSSIRPKEIHFEEANLYIYLGYLYYFYLRIYVDGTYKNEITTQKSIWFRGSYLVLLLRLNINDSFDLLSNVLLRSGCISESSLFPTLYFT